MKTNQKQVLLNRAALAARPYDSTALTVLTTLLHRFNEVGDFDVFVRGGGGPDRRLRLRVTPDNAPYQQNIDLAALGMGTSSAEFSTRLAGREQSCCAEGQEVSLHAGGVVGFYASQGSAGYSVVIKRLDAREKRVLLDSAAQIPEGDLFAVTLVRPGTYRVAELLGGKAEARVQVVMPPAPKKAADPGLRKEPPYRTDKPTLVTYNRDGFSSKELRIYAGQSAVFHCLAPARLRVELVKPDQPPGKPGEKPRVTRGKPPAAALKT